MGGLGRQFRWYRSPRSRRRRHAARPGAALQGRAPPWRMARSAARIVLRHRRQSRSVPCPRQPGAFVGDLVAAPAGRGLLDADGAHLRPRGRLGGAFALTQLPAGGRAADRAPAALSFGAAGMRFVFASDRGGGTRLYQLTSPAGGPGSAPVAVSPLAQGSRADLAGAGERRRRDLADRPRRRECRAGAECAPPPAPPAPSYRAAEAAALRRRAAGALTPRPDDVARRNRARAFGDLMSYTPQNRWGRWSPRFRTTISTRPRPSASTCPTRSPTSRSPPPRRAACAIF